MSSYLSIINFLNENKISFEEIIHEVVETCEDSARCRTEAWFVWLGSKNIFFHCKWNFYLVVTHASKQIKARNFKHEFGSKDIRFANQDEIDQIAGVKIGSIPPIIPENKELQIFVDLEIFESDYFMFNPADPTRTLRISTKDLKKVYEILDNSVKYFVHTDEYFEILE